MDSNETASLAPSESESLSKNTVSVNGYDKAGSVSDDEGYPSGEEEFETASEDSAKVGTVGEDNFDEPFVDAPSDVGILPDSEAVDVDDDDGVETFSSNDVEGGEYALEKGEAVDVDKLDLDEIGGGDSGKLVFDEVEMNGGDEREYEGDSVVNNVSSSGAAVVEKIDENGDINNEKDAKEVVNRGVDSEEDCVVDDGIQVDGDGKIDGNGDVARESNAKEVIETGENATEDNNITAKSVTRGEIEADRDGDQLHHSNVEGDEYVLEKGEVVAVDKLDLDLDEIGDGDSGILVSDEVEMNGGDECEFEGDSVVDVSSSGAAAVEKIDENGDINNEKDAKEMVEPEKSEVVNCGVVSEEDCVDDGIQVDGDGKMDGNGDVANESDAKEVIGTGENATEVNNITPKSVTNGDIGADRDENQLHHSNGGFEDEFVPEESGQTDFNEAKVKNDGDNEVEFIEEFDQTTGVDSSEQEEEGDTDDDEGEDGNELFDSAALSALLKAAASAANSDGSGNITIMSRDGTKLFTVERPAGPESSLRALRPAPQPNPFSLAPSNSVGVSEDSLSEEEKKNLEKLQQVRVKFLRLVHRLGLSPDEPVAAQVLYQLGLLGGRKGTGVLSLDAAKNMALQLETDERDNLDFSVNFLILGKPGVGKSATINSIFGEEKAHIDPFENGTAYTKEISGFVDGVKIRVLDTPGLKSSLMEQSFNYGVLSSVKKQTKKNPPDVVLYVDRLDSQTRDLNDLPILKAVTNSLGPSIWQNAIVTLTHAACDPPDGLNGTPLSYEMFVAQRSHLMHQSIGNVVGPGVMNPVSLVENRKNGRDEKMLPNGQIWRPQLLLLCYSMKILSEAGSIIKPDRKILGFRARSPPLPYMLSSMLQARPHPKMDDVDSDIDSDELSEPDEEQEDEYDGLPPFKPLKKAQIENLTKDQKHAYFEEYDYRVKLLQKKQWREELSRMREIKKNGKDFADVDAGDDEADPVAVPLPDMALPPSFDGDSPVYRYRFLEPGSRFLARPVLDSHGWDHDCGYDGINLEHALVVDKRFPVSYTVQITKDKKDFTFSLDSSISAKHGEDKSSMVGFDIQSMGKQMAYTVRGETKIKKFKRNKAGGGVFLTFLGENVVPGLKIEDRVTLGKRYVLVGSGGAVGSGKETAYGANIEVQRRESGYPIGEVESTLGVSIVKWRGDWALGINSLAQFSMGRNSKVAVRAGINNKVSGQISIKTSSSDNLVLALAAVVPVAISVYRKLWPGADETYSIY